MAQDRFGIEVRRFIEGVITDRNALDPLYGKYPDYTLVWIGDKDIQPTIVFKEPKWVYFVALALSVRECLIGSLAHLGSTTAPSNESIVFSMPS